MKKLELLDIKKHANLKWECLGSRCPNSCCKTFFSVYVTLSEVSLVSRFFPVVVVFDGKSLFFSALTKLKEDQNGCIYLKGACSLENEKPLFCRAYPFFVLKGENDKNLVGFDTFCSGFSENTGNPVFPEEGNIDRVIDNNFLRYAYILKRDASSNKEFFDFIRDKDLLSGGKFAYKVGDKNEELTFNFIDEKKISSLSEKDLKFLIDKGYLRIIYSHINSLRNFYKLINAYITRRNGE